ncbi:MAG: glutathione S-transferase family protein [Pseudomonadales bacterium]|nr:glutathione S-transferase family protein [Pseudomonadales bacterium]
MSKLKFYTNPWSRGRIVRWMLEELQVPYDVEVRGYDGDIKAPDYLAINPMGKVPALMADKTIITETVAICTWLADRFPEKGLAPALDSPLRGSYYRWLFFAAGPLEMAMSAKAFNWTIDKKIAQSVGCGMLEDVTNTLEGALGSSPFICGDSFTTADLVLASNLGWALSQNQIDARPGFADYVARMQQREAARRANELDDALVAAA